MGISSLRRRSVGASQPSAPPLASRRAEGRRPAAPSLEGAPGSSAKLPAAFARVRQVGRGGRHSPVVTLRRHRGTQGLVLRLKCRGRACPCDSGRWRLPRRRVSPRDWPWVTGTPARPERSAQPQVRHEGAQGPRSRVGGLLPDAPLAGESHAAGRGREAGRARGGERRLQGPSCRPAPRVPGNSRPASPALGVPVWTPN